MTLLRDALLASTVARLLRAEEELTWTAVEGVGFMRTDLVRTETETVSLHIWHPDLRAVGMEDSGMIHDHRYAFRSLVLVGAIHDTEIVSLVPTDEHDGTYQIHEAKWIGGMNPLSVTEQPERYRLVTSKHTYRPGTTFAYPANKFHRAEVSELSVTVCWKAGAFGGGRLLARAGHKPVHVGDGWGLDRFTRERVRDLRRAAGQALLLELSAKAQYPRPWLLG